jgi:hypothetical protein
MRTLRAEQIKKLKLSEEFICATPRAFIEDSAPQKNNSKDIKRGVFCGAGFYKRREKKLQREEKRCSFPGNR